MDFAMAHINWTIDDWKRVVYTDETKVNRLGSDGRKWVWKMPGEGLSDVMTSDNQFGLLTVNHFVVFFIQSTR